jgi:hypothetical protein
MRTNIDNLAKKYSDTIYGIPKQFQPIELTEIQLEHNVKSAYKEGFNSCYNLVKPLLDKAIEDFKDEYGDNEDYKYTYEKIQEFLEKYEQ